VKRNFQSQGNGKSLLESLISILKRNHYNRIFLEVNTKNFAAISLYTQFGFKNKNIRKDYYFESGIYYDAKNMELIL
jgi:ribosomal-protein-alanine N-acetyltransferase